MWVAREKATRISRCHLLHTSPHIGRIDPPPACLENPLPFSRALNHPLVGAPPPRALAGFGEQSFPTHRSVGSRHQTGTIFPAECGPVHLPRSPASYSLGVTPSTAGYSNTLSFDSNLVA